ncbi:hypothetical protein HC341_16665 [Aquisalimonas sp. 2447]|uniref:PQQ-dependent sugar dehydrogenase n=1 Tax=Aquisalimonas sp. 2447 TaxID=2740807 RepID=UPI00143257FD|nr:PQQ-dependent sugar dehydrogenase [Aquisalimonas sp. 2447]QIT56682.1 hypothetical protein HC341_16665 [Aquisalimonas sp. 2447]
MNIRHITAAILVAALWQVPQLAMAAPEEACKQETGMPVVPGGFCARLVAVDLGPMGHMDVTDDGDLYVAIQNTPDGPGGIAGLRDTDGDGWFDEQVRFGERGGVGLAIQGDRLFLAEPGRVLSSPLHEGRLGPRDSPRVIAHGFPDTDAPRSLVVHEDGVFVSVATARESCPPDEQATATAAPCRERDRAAGIWFFQRDEAGQSQEDAEHYAAGLRDATGMSWNPREEQLYALGQAPGPLTRRVDDQAPMADRLPQVADELLRIGAASDFGWPYCYYDAARHRRLETPDYERDGKPGNGCKLFRAPEMTFPGARAPTDLLFYSGHQFPEHYRQSAFAAFAGDTDTPPVVTALSLDDEGRLTGERSVFVEGLPAGPAPRGRAIISLAQSPDGSLYLGDSRHGSIWRIDYVGEPDEEQ